MNEDTTTTEETQEVANIHYSPCVFCGVGGDPVGRIHIHNTEGN